MTTNTQNQVQQIDAAELSNVTGGGPIGWAVKAAKKYGPQIADKAVDAAKWTGIPAAVGAGAAWAKHQWDKR